MTLQLDQGPSCECSHVDRSHPYGVHTDEGCTEWDSYGLPCDCPGFTPLEGDPRQSWHP
ncbi:hypothetical protein [Plantactinospora sp. WMMB782]|uniref:hypothetical protein n=1 Tax=Plantactinospora sp. WMMB782 TaxID=3404121 RepID=UPI003B965326